MRERITPAKVYSILSGFGPSNLTDWQAKRLLDAAARIYEAGIEDGRNAEREYRHALPRIVIAEEGDR